VLLIGYPGSCKTSLLNMAVMGFKEGMISEFKSNVRQSDSDTAMLARTDFRSLSVSLIDVPGFDKNWSKQRLNRALDGALKSGRDLLQLSLADSIRTQDLDEIVRNKPNVMWVVCPLQSKYSEIVQSTTDGVAPGSTPEQINEAVVQAVQLQLIEQWWCLPGAAKDVSIKSAVEAAMKRGIFVQFIVTRFHEIRSLNEKQPFDNPQRAVGLTEFKVVKQAIERCVRSTGFPYSLEEHLPKQLLGDVYALLTVPSDVSDSCKFDPESPLPKEWQPTLNFTIGQMRIIFSKTKKLLKLQPHGRFDNEVITPATLIQF